MSGNSRFDLVINGTQATVWASPGTTLLAVIRDHLGLMGTKEACGRGECGACTVLHGDDAVPSCVMLTALVTKPVQTVEAVAFRCKDLRARIAECGGMQCGFCTPGQVVRAAALNWTRVHSLQQLREEMSGNICRCTGYVGLLDAIWESRPRGSEAR